MSKYTEFYKIVIIYQRHEIQNNEYKNRKKL